MVSYLFALVALFWGNAEIQVAIPKVPKPNETLRFRMVQEMNIQMSMQDSDQQAAQPAPEVTKMLGKTTFAFTQKTGTRTRQGRVPVDITYDQILVERSVNGRPAPGEGLGSDLVGQTVSLTYDKDGKIVDVKVPPGLDMSPDALKEMITSLMGSLPEGSLRIGEVATMPFSTPLPVPSPNGEEMKMAGQSRYTLVALTREGTDRIAEFRQDIEAKLITVAEMPLPSGPGKVHISFKLSGGGTLRLNIDKGVIRSADVQSAISGDMYMTAAGSDQKLHSMQLQGTTKTSASSTP